MERVFLNCFYGTLVLVLIHSVLSLTGDHVCPEHQKYNVTKRIKYRAPMAVKSYKWCLAVPPRCSVWTTEMRDVTRLETEERSAEVSVCCPGFKISGNICVPKCEVGKKGSLCDEACATTEWGASCTNRCNCSINAACSPVDGTCGCIKGWRGRKCDEEEESFSMSNTPDFDLKSKDMLPNKNNGTHSNISIKVQESMLLPNTTIKLATEIAPVTKKRVLESELITNVSQPTTAISNTIPSTTTTTTAKNILTTFKHEATELVSKANNTIVNSSVEKVMDHQSLSKPKNNVSKGTSNTEGDESYKNTNRSEFENTDTKHKTTTPKTIVVSIITTIADVSINRQGADSGKSNKNETSKKNGTVITTSPIWHIFRLPSQDKYSTIFYKNKTRAPYYYNSTSKTLFTTKSPNLSFKFSSNLTTLIPMLPSTNYVRIKFNESDLKVMKKRNDPKFSFENVLKIYSLLNQELNRKAHASTSNPAMADLENRTHIQNVVKSKNLAHIKDAKHKAISKKSNELISFPNKVKANNATGQNPTSVPNYSLLYNSASTSSSKSIDKLRTEDAQSLDDILHVLTEPAAVADDSMGKRNSDLFSVLIIACGVTLVVISLAVLIVMIDQCKVERRQYSDVIMNSNSNLRSNHQLKTFQMHITHVPLPKPPLPEGHYQPIATLDKQLKQFMRPVIINTPVSAKMMDDFRDIIESHYDHLPARNNSDLRNIRNIIDERVSSETSSINTPSIFASSCEKINVVADENASINFYNNVDEYCENNDEPLYDEIPSLLLQQPDEQEPGRGEAVTEL